MNDILRQEITAERVFYIVDNQELSIKPTLSGFMEQVNSQGLVKTLKDLGMYETRGRGQNKGVWCNPYIWMLLALELNPEIYGKVIVWLTDKLIFNRIEAGVLYRPLTEQIQAVLVPQMPSPKDAYREVAIAINEKVFGKHETGIRNSATAIELKKLTTIEMILTQIIKDGFLKTPQEVKDYIAAWI